MQKLIYNAQGQLAQLRDANNAVIASYVYRGDGKRAWKEVANGQRSYFYYSGEMLIAGTNGVDASGLQLWGADGLVGSRSFNSTTGVTSKSYNLYDTQGNLAQTIDAATGSVASQSAVNAWGEPIRDSAGNVAGAGYGAKFGYIRDGESGFYLCTLRYYDASAGRWLTRDPIGYNGGSNLYGYVGNDPVNATDPSGLAERPKSWGPEKIAIVFNAFIPDYTANAPGLNNGFTGSFKGDNRGFDSNDGSYRTMHTIVMNRRTGKATAWEDVGISTTIQRGFGLLPNKSRKAKNRKSLQTWVNGDNCRGWDIHIEGNGKDGLTPEAITAGITYRIQMHVSPSGIVSNFHIGHIDSYPAYEIWEYRNAFSAMQIYGQMPNDMGTVFNLVPIIGGSGSSWK